MKRQHESIVALATIAVFLCIVMFFPAIPRAGNLEPNGPPGPTMKTLDVIPPTWSQKLPVSERFVLVLDGSAVLDKETGLVWERSPNTTPKTWIDACIHCYQREVDGRKGWRLSTVEELASLVDPANTNPSLPNGHPFGNVQSAHYWSSTSNAYGTNAGWAVGFSQSYVFLGDKADSFYVWCVRGGYGHDAY